MSRNLFEKVWGIFFVFFSNLKLKPKFYILASFIHPKREELNN